MPELEVNSGGNARSWDQGPRVARRHVKNILPLTRGFGISNQMLEPELRRKKVTQVSAGKFGQSQSKNMPLAAESDLVSMRLTNNVLGAAYNRLVNARLRAVNDRILLEKYKTRISAEQIKVLSSLMGSLHVTGLEQPEDWKYHYRID